MRWIIQSFGSSSRRRGTARSGPLQPLAVQPTRPCAAPTSALVGAVVPDRHRPGAVLALRDLALEVEVLERVVLGADRPAVLLRVLGDAASGIAQEASAPSRSRRRSQCRRVALCSWTTKRGALGCGGLPRPSAPASREVAFLAVAGQRSSASRLPTAWRGSCAERILAAVDNVEIVRDAYERFRASRRVVAELAAPDFVWDMSHFHGWRTRSTRASRGQNGSCGNGCGLGCPGSFTSRRCTRPGTRSSRSSISTDARARAGFRSHVLCAGMDAARRQGDEDGHVLRPA